MRTVLMALGVVVLLSGCSSDKCEPKVITVERVVTKEVPIKPNIPVVQKPNFSGLNPAQKVEAEVAYRKSLEAALNGLR